MVTTTFNASVQAFEYQQTQVGSLTETIPQNKRALTILTARKGGTYDLLEEYCFHVNWTGRIKQEIKSVKDNSLLADRTHARIGDYTNLFSWLPSGIVSWLRTITQTGSLTIILSNMHIMLTKCFLKIVTSAITHSTMWLMFAQMTILDAFYQDGFYRQDKLESNKTTLALRD